MEHQLITPENLIKIGFEVVKENNKTCYRRRKLLFWFEKGIIKGEWATPYNVERLKEEIEMFGL